VRPWYAKKASRLLVSMTLIVLASCSMLAPVVRGHSGDVVTCYRAIYPVTIGDGKLDQTEWEDSVEVVLTPNPKAPPGLVGYFRAKHDGTYLYCLFEHLNWTRIDLGDEVIISIDTKHDGGSLPQPDDFSLAVVNVETSRAKAALTYGERKPWPRFYPIQAPSDVVYDMFLDSSSHSLGKHFIVEVKMPLSTITKKVPTAVGFNPVISNYNRWSDVALLYPSGSNHNIPNTWADLKIVDEKLTSS